MNQVIILDAAGNAELSAARGAFDPHNNGAAAQIHHIAFIKRIMRRQRDITLDLLASGESFIHNEIKAVSANVLSSSSQWLFHAGTSQMNSPLDWSSEIPAPFHRSTPRPLELACP